MTPLVLTFRDVPQILSFYQGYGAGRAPLTEWRRRLLPAPMELGIKMKKALWTSYRPTGMRAVAVEVSSIPGDEGVLFLQYVLTVA